MNRKSQLHAVNLARRMRAQGILLEIPEDDSELISIPAVGLHILQTGVSRIFKINSYQSGYIVDLNIISNFSWPFEISRIELELPWHTEPIDWLADPDATIGIRPNYRFPGEYPLEFPRDEVLNHVIGTHHTLRRGKVVSGLLLGVGSEIPEDTPPGSVPGNIYVYDQFDSRYSTSFFFSVDRSDKAFCAKAKKKKRKSLLDSPDPVKPWISG